MGTVNYDLFNVVLRGLPQDSFIDVCSTVLLVSKTEHVLHIIMRDQWVTANSGCVCPGCGWVDEGRIKLDALIFNLLFKCFFMNQK